MARTPTSAGGCSRSAVSASFTTATSTPRHGATWRWGRAQSFVSTSATSRPRSCTTGPRTRRISTSDRSNRMPGYEPFLLCDFHVHTRWSDGKLTIGEVVDLYGSSGKFDVIAITDHILMKNDLLARAGRLATLGRRAYGVRKDDFEAYLADIRQEAKRALKTYGMLVIPGAEITQNRLRGKKNSHVIALDIKEYISADQTAAEILRAIRRQGGVSIACHPHHRTTRRIEISTCYLWDHREELSDLVEV